MALRAGKELIASGRGLRGFYIFMDSQSFWIFMLHF